MRLANILATACAALLVFVVGGGAWFMTFLTLVFVLTSSLPVGYGVGAVTGGLVRGARGDAFGPEAAAATEVVVVGVQWTA